jgi:hypothetical protein
MRLIPEAAGDLYEAQVDMHRELRLGPDQVDALFNIARGFRRTSEGKAAMQQSTRPLPEAPCYEAQVQANRSSCIGR